MDNSKYTNFNDLLETIIKEDNIETGSNNSILYQVHGITGTNQIKINSILDTDNLSNIVKIGDFKYDNYSCTIVSLLLNKSDIDQHIYKIVSIILQHNSDKNKEYALTLEYDHNKQLFVVYLLDKHLDTKNILDTTDKFPLPANIVYFMLEYLSHIDVLNLILD
jgi:hypothetical protein